MMVIQGTFVCVGVHCSFLSDPGNIKVMVVVDGHVTDDVNFVGFVKWYVAASCRVSPCLMMFGVLSLTPVRSVQGGQTIALICVVL